MQPATVHYLSLRFVNAERLSPSKVASKAKAGWVWHRLVPGFSAIGGTANYDRVLVDPATGALAFVSDRASGPAVSDLPELHTDYTLVSLAVPFEAKAEAKALGAVWVPNRRTWACAPFEIERFRSWIAGAPATFSLLDDPRS